MPHMSTMLWFDTQAEEAAAFYVSVFPNSRIVNTARRPEHSPGGGGVGVMLVEFELEGRRFSALKAGPLFKFNESVSSSSTARPWRR